MTDKEQKAIYLMQSIVFSNYAKLCIQLEQVPDIVIIKMVENCESVKKLNETNNIILKELKH